MKLRRNYFGRVFSRHDLGNMRYEENCETNCLVAELGQLATTRPLQCLWHTALDEFNFGESSYARSSIYRGGVRF